MKKLIVVIILACTLLATGAQAAWASPPATNPIIHIVQWGENLIGIANRYGTTVWAIMQANSIANQNRIYAGQRLVIPVAAATPVTSACSYVVCYGDNLTGIAYRYGVSISSIMRANGIVNPNMINYTWRPFNELPEIKNVILETPFPSHRFGAVGVGEIATAPGPSAILMAVSNAIGARLYSYPVTPEKILRTLGKI